MAITLLSNNLEDRFLGSDSSGNFTYVAFASDTSGSNFSTTYNSSIHLYKGIIVTGTEITTLNSSYFVGKWVYCNPLSVITGLQADIDSNSADITSLEGTVTTKTNIDGTNLATGYASIWRDFVNYNQYNTESYDILYGNTDIPSTVKYLEVTNNSSAGFTADLSLPDPAAQGNRGYILNIYINCLGGSGGDGIRIRYLTTIYYTNIFGTSPLKKNISFISNGTSWSILNQDIQGSIYYPGVWEKATSSEVTSGTTDKVLTADNISNLTSTETRAGIQANATLEEALLFTAANKTITPSVLGDILNNVKCKSISIGNWNMDTTSSISVDLTSLGLVSGTNFILHSAVIIFGNNGYYTRLENVTSSGTLSGGVSFVETESATLYRTTGGEFDDSNYSGDVSSTYGERGTLYIWYI